jgi:hypothetical protein
MKLYRDVSVVGEAVQGEDALKARECVEAIRPHSSLIVPDLKFLEAGLKVEVSRPHWEL